MITLIDVSQKKMSKISWENEVSNYFLKELKEMFSEKTCKSIISSTIKFRSKKSTTVLYWNGKYFKVTNSATIKEISIEDILYTPKFNNSFIEELFHKNK